MERQILNFFNIEWLEALWSVLALISAALSVYLWKRAAAVPSLPMSRLSHRRGELDCMLRPVPLRSSLYSF